MRERRAEWVDEAVDNAREVCRQGRLPERSAVQTLVRFASQASSGKEAVLFIRYQGARTSHSQRRFFDAVARVIEEQYARDLSDLRAFLRLVVLTHTVESRSPVREVARNLRDVIDGSPRRFDVFISHASEDKEGLVRPLAKALRDAGLQVWYDEFELKLGDNLRRKIDAGIRQARFGLVVLSEAFLSKQWTQYELDGIVTADMTGKQILLPLWHGVGEDEVFNFSPSLADKMAMDTSAGSLNDLVRQLVDVIRASEDR